MPTLLETVAELEAVKATPIIKTRQALNISASSSRASKKFVATQVDLTKIPLLATGDNEGPLVIDVNASHMRQTKSGFIPKIIILSGSDKVRAAKRTGEMICDAFVGEKIFDIKKLSITASAITKAVFACDPASPVAMVQESILDLPNDGPALGGLNAPRWANRFGRSQGYDVSNFGAPGSELNNPMLRTMLNVEEALKMYQSEKQIGVHKVVYTPYAHVPPGLINAGREATIAATAAGLDLEKFSVRDFLQWQHNKLTMKASVKVKNVDGSELALKDFAYVGDTTDQSTWHCATNTVSACEASLSELQSTTFIPKKEKSEVKVKIEAAGGPHLGLGDSAKKHLDKIATRDAKKKKVKAVGPPMTMNINSKKRK